MGATFLKQYISNKGHIGIVMTNQYFTAAAKEAAEKTGVLLWDRDYIDKMII
jgi:HJR/Mrr/RecB family endonuclease